MRGPARGEQPLYWVGSAKRDLLAFPEAVKDGIGTALSIAQFGGKHPRGEAMERSGIRSTGGCGESRRKHLSRRLYRPLPLGRIRVALFSEEVA